LRALLRLEQLELQLAASRADLGDDLDTHRPPGQPIGGVEGLALQVFVGPRVEDRERSGQIEVPPGDPHRVSRFCSAGIHQGHPRSTRTAPVLRKDAQELAAFPVGRRGRPGRPAVKQDPEAQDDHDHDRQATHH
jgi:hypothetical protein